MTPDDQAAAASVVRRAWESGTPVYPIGGGTSLLYGAWPSRPGLGLSLAQLNRVVDYPARDLTITVEAGVTIAELAAHLASERQCLPIDVPQADRATVGGVVAANPSGPRQYRYGTIREYVIGIGAVDGRGTAFAAGGRVVKNAAGYDLCRLLTGSLGTLGVTTQVTLRVKPMPETSALMACNVTDFEVAERLLAGLVHTKTVPAAIEFLVGPAWQGDAVLSAGPEPGAGRLVVGLEGTSSEVEWMIEQLDKEWRGSARVAPVAVRGEACLASWKRLTEFPGGASEGNGIDPLVVEIRVLPSAAVDFMGRLLDEDSNCSIQAHAGDGILRVRFSRDPAEMTGLVGQRLRRAVAAGGGSLVVLRYPPEARLSRTEVWGAADEGLTVMQSIKSRFDPKGILNPDRFVYGNP